MNGKVFFDSNILIYAYSIDAPSKRAIVESILNQHEKIIISTQIINEFVNVMTKKKKLTYQQIVLVIQELSSVFSITTITIEIIQKAISIADKHHYSYFDSLIIASALSNNCSIFYSEDMHHQHILEGSLKIINPFL